MSLGQLVVELQANLAKTQEDMGRLNQIVEATMQRVDQSAARASRSIENIGNAGRTLRRMEGAEDAAKSIEKVGHASAGARREVLVLAHELSQGNFKRAAGSLMVLGERLDIMGKVMSPVGLTIGAVALALGIFATAAIKGAIESQHFAETLKLTGNFAGQTEGSYNAMARSIAAATGSTVASAREITEGLIATGRIGRTSLEAVSVAATKFAEVSGQKGEEVVKEFSKMSDGALKWAVEQNRQYHFVDGALFEHVRALEEAGKSEQAMIAVSDALTAHLGGEQAENLGTLSRLWHGLKMAIDGAKQSMLDIGRTDTNEQIAQRLQDRISSINAHPETVMGIEGPHKPLDALGPLQSQLNDVSKKILREQDNALLASQKTDHDSIVVESKKFYYDWVKAHKEGAQQLKEALDEVQKKFTDAGHPEAIAAAQAKIRKEFADKGGGNLPRAELGQDIKPLQDQISAEDKLLAYREQVLNGYYKRDQISIEGYYATRTTVIQANATRVAALYDQEIAAEEKYANSTKGATHIEALTRANALRDAQEQTALRTSEQIDLLNEEKAASTEKYRAEVEKLASELDKLNNRQGTNAGADFDRSHAGLRKQATAAGDDSTLATLAEARNAAVAQGQMNALKEQAQVITEKLGIVEKQVALDEVTGQKTQLEGMILISKARGESAAQLEILAQKMQEVAEQSGMPVLINNAQQFKQQTDQLSDSANVLGKNINETFANGFAKTLDNTINRTKTLKQSFLDMGASIEQEIEKMVSQDLANTLFGIGGASGNTGWLQQIIGIGIGLLGGDATGSEAIGASSSSTPDDLIAGYRASGGPTMAGGMYEVNERGPELLTVANRTFLMMGDQAGKVTPTGDAGNGGSGRNTFNMNIAVPAGTTRQTAQQQAGAIMRQAQIAMARNN